MVMGATEPSAHQNINILPVKFFADAELFEGYQTD